MPLKDNTILKNDLRILKTRLALMESMCSLLKEKQFNKVTVEEICKEGMISRATFYSHFSDKYDLLEYWLLNLWTHKITKSDAFEFLKNLVEQFTNENKKVLRNLLIETDEYSFVILNSFLCSVFNVENTKRVNGKIIQKNAVVVNLYINGIINYLIWQARNNFPPDVPMINEYSFEAVKKLCDWARE